MDNHAEDVAVEEPQIGTQRQKPRAAIVGLTFALLVALLYIVHLKQQPPAREPAFTYSSDTPRTNEDWAQIQQALAENNRPENLPSALRPWAEYLPEFDYEMAWNHPGSVRVFNRRMRGEISYQIFIFLNDSETIIQSITMNASVEDNTIPPDLTMPLNHFLLILERLQPDCCAVLRKKIAANDVMNFPNEGRMAIKGYTKSNWFVEANSSYGALKGEKIVLGVQLINGDD